MFDVTMTTAEHELTVEMSSDIEFNAGLNEAGAGVNDYAYLANKPRINGVELSGDQTEAQIGIEALTINEMHSILEEILK